MGPLDRIAVPAAASWLAWARDSPTFVPWSFPAVWLRADPPLQFLNFIQSWVALAVLGNVNAALSPVLEQFEQRLRHHSKHNLLAGERLRTGSSYDNPILSSQSYDDT
ncbi:hypothetical protein HD806DRAFT_553177 [Xylariaceae sp. AK1471]|nr:hypothetical protein HD806DRAFT_553177 [Xylariaceae sp. AK1471]